MFFVCSFIRNTADESVWAGFIVGIVGLVMVASSPGFVCPGDGIEEVEGGCC